MDNYKRIAVKFFDWFMDETNPYIYSEDGKLVNNLDGKEYSTDCLYDVFIDDIALEQQFPLKGFVGIPDSDWREATNDLFLSRKDEQDHNRRMELIKKYQNGWEKYNKEPLFRTIIEHAARGADPWDIIDKLIEMNKQISDRFRKLIEQWPSPNWPNVD